jgi:hypothetical protein
MIAPETSTHVKKLRFLLSLTNDDNDYQIEQTSAAQQAARKLGVELEVVYARNEISGSRPCRIPLTGVA